MVYDVKTMWYRIKTKCYSARYAYMDCEVCDEWMLDFQAFERWFFENLYNCKEPLEIDKNLFGNGKLYSPETCCLLPRTIRIALAYRKNKWNGLPTGVNRTASGKYEAKICRMDGHLCKSFDTIEKADKFYRRNKERHIHDLAYCYRKVLPAKIYNALANYKCK